MQRLSYSSFFIARFSVRVAGQQLEINPVHFTVFHHNHHFAGLKSPAILLKILYAIALSSRSSNWSFPFILASKANMLTKFQSFSKKIFYYSEFSIGNNNKHSHKTWKMVRLVLPRKSTRKPTMITLPRTQAPLQINNLIVTFAQLSLTWQML